MVLRCPCKLTGRSYGHLAVMIVSCIALIKGAICCAFYDVEVMKHDTKQKSFTMK